MQSLGPLTKIGNWVGPPTHGVLKGDEREVFEGARVADSKSSLYRGHAKKLWGGSPWEGKGGGEILHWRERKMEKG